MNTKRKLTERGKNKNIYKKRMNTKRKLTEREKIKICL